MGTGGSFLRSADEDDVTGTDDGNSREVIKRIPIEVKPRGKIGLRTGWSIGKTKGSGSMRSALSVDLDSIEVEKVRKEFDIYRLSKENEIASMQKKVLKLETENRRLRAELQVRTQRIVLFLILLIFQNMFTYWIDLSADCAKDLPKAAGRERRSS